MKLEAFALILYEPVSGRLGAMSLPLFMRKTTWLLVSVARVLSRATETGLGDLLSVLVNLNCSSKGNTNRYLERSLICQLRMIAAHSSLSIEMISPILCFGV